jgi:hypothetical protein
MLAIGSTTTITLLTAIAATAAPSANSGSVRLNPAELKRVERATCGQLSGAWTPGAVTAGKFLAHARKAANLRAIARGTTGSSAAKLRRQAAALQATARRQAVPCRQPNGAMRLSRSNLRSVGAIQCGKVDRTRWLPGVLAAGYFTSHAQQESTARIEARHARTAAARRRATARATSFRTRANAERQACSNTGAGTTTSLRIDVRGAAGIARRAQGSSSLGREARRRQLGTAATGSNLAVVLANGTVRDAITAGSASVRDVVVADDDTVFLAFNGTVQIDGAACVLARVAPTSDVPTCVDSSLRSIWSSGAVLDLDEPIQRDGAGAVYYAGQDAQDRLVLRRWKDGATTDLITDNVWLTRFLVRPDGSVIVSGRTKSTGQGWTRRILPTGGLQTLASSDARFLATFPDGNLYVGLWDGYDMGVRRLIAGATSLDPTFWISGNVNGIDRPAVHDGALCNIPGSGGGYCTFPGDRFATTSSGEVYGVNTVGQATSLMQVFPTLASVPSAVTSPTRIRAVGDALYVAGRNASNQHVLVRRDTTTDLESELIAPANELEVYHLGYSSATNSVLFDGLRFADNRYVLGSIDLVTGAVTISLALDAKWDDFQTFE